MMRLRRYTKEERMALDHWEKEKGQEKGCRLQKAVAGNVKAATLK
jgi:hypothetical protein